MEPERFFHTIKVRIVTLIYKITHGETSEIPPSLHILRAIHTLLIIIGRILHLRSDCASFTFKGVGQGPHTCLQKLF
jgi:hypothetical protein